MEIVAKLISTKLLDVVFTTDGKEYVTPKHLTKELKDEAYVQGGVYYKYLNIFNKIYSVNNFYVNLCDISLAVYKFIDISD